MLRTRAKYLALQALSWTPIVVSLVLLAPQLAEARDALFTAGSILPVVHVLLIPFLPLLVVSSVISLWALPSQKRFDAYLAATWRGDGAQPPLADQQPEPDATTLALPTTIRLRPRWHVIMGIDVLFFLIGSLYIVAYIFTDTPPSSQPDPLAVLAFAILALFVIMAPFTQRTSGKGFTVSEEGLKMHNMPTSTPDMYAIKWSEARLFAIADGRKKRPGEVVYMLAAPGPGKFANWPRLCQPPRWYSTLEPTVPLAEHDQQMQALLSLIAARTGLPLRDLR